jgi:hypothetical protein
MEKTRHLNRYLRYVLEVTYNVLRLSTILLRQHGSEMHERPTPCKLATYPNPDKRSCIHPAGIDSNI